MFKNNDCKDNIEGCYCLAGVPEVAEPASWKVYAGLAFLMIVIVTAIYFFGVR